MWLMLMVLGSLGREQLPTTADTIEVNHTPRFSQVIIWQWSEDYNRLDCIDYWLINRSLHHLDEMPTGPLSPCGFWRANYGERKYQAKDYRETWTEHDPERDNARLFPQGMRCCR